MLSFFFESGLARHDKKQPYRKTNRCKNSSDIEACTSVKTDRKENIKFIVTNYKDRFTSKITTT